MQLKAFVQSVLVEICAGVQASQHEVQGLGGFVNPKGSQLGKDESVSGRVQLGPGDYAAVSKVDFDVAVAATEGDEKSAGGGIIVASLQFGGRRSSEASKSTESRIRFAVPVVLPQQAVPGRDRLSR